MVGYTKVSLTAGLNLLGSQFVQVGTDAPLDIQAILKADGFAGYALDTSETFIAQTEFWTYNEGYTYYGYVSAENAAEWDMPELTGKWVDEYFDIAVANVDASKGLWIKALTPSEVVFSGQVFSEESAVIALNVGLNLVANPFPVSWNIQDFVASGMAGYILDSSETFVAQTELWIYDGGYSYYGYVSAENAAEWEMPELAGMWVDEYFEVANVSILPGHGFWVKNPTAGTITLDSPLQ